MTVWIDWRVGQPPRNAKLCQTTECGHPKGSHGVPTIATRNWE